MKSLILSRPVSSSVDNFTLKSNTSFLQFERPTTKVYKELLVHSRNDFLYTESLVKGLKADHNLKLDLAEVTGNIYY